LLASRRVGHAREETSSQAERLIEISHRPNCTLTLPLAPLSPSVEVARYPIPPWTLAHEPTRQTTCASGSATKNPSLYQPRGTVRVPGGGRKRSLLILQCRESSSQRHQTLPKR